MFRSIPAKLLLMNSDIDSKLVEHFILALEGNEGNIFASRSEPTEPPRLEAVRRNFLSDFSRELTGDSFRISDVAPAQRQNQPATNAS